MRTWQHTEEHYQARGRRYGQDLPFKQRSQEELERLAVPAHWPEHGVMCLMRDGSETDMFDGLHAMEMGATLAHSMYAQVTPLAYCCSWQ